jgi:hypothetical protein
MSRRRRNLRERLEAAIERAITALDQLDGDPDLEENGDLEPSFGGNYWADKIEIELEGDASDDEPWLGWTEEAQYPGGRSNEGCDDLDGARFSGQGAREANAILAGRRLPTVRLPIGYGDQT